MTANGDVAEQIVHISLEGIDYSVRIAGQSFSTITRFIKTIAASRASTKGTKMINSLIKSGKPLMVFSIPADKLNTFDRIAQKFGIEYCIGFNDGAENGVIDIVAEKEHSSRIERIISVYLPREEKKEDIKETPSAKKENETEGEFLARMVKNEEKKREWDIDDNIPDRTDEPVIQMVEHREPAKIEVKGVEDPPPRISLRGKQYTHGTRKRKEEGGIELRKQIPQRAVDR